MYSKFLDGIPAHIVLKKLADLKTPVKTTIVTYELCKRNFYSWVSIESTLSNKNLCRVRWEIGHPYNACNFLLTHG